MRCRQCNYPLWNLSSPQCPECGTGFDLRSYTFAPGTVAFGCPHCGALHGGTGPQYLPATTDTATCQSCAQPMSVMHMRVVPLSDQTEAIVANQIPWEVRAGSGVWRAWWETCRMAMLEPEQLGRQITPAIPFWSGYWFAVLTIILGAVVNAVVALTCFGTLLAVMSAGGGGGQPTMNNADLIIQMVSAVVQVPFAFLTPFLLVGIMGGAAHLVLLATGPKRGGFGLTALAFLFGQGPMAVAIVPFCGGYVGYVWALIATVFVLKSAQGISGGRAALAVLLLPALMLVLGVLAVALVIGVALATA